MATDFETSEGRLAHHHPLRGSQALLTSLDTELQQVSHPPGLMTLERPGTQSPSLTSLAPPGYSYKFAAPSHAITQLATPSPRTPR